ncbi:hypothetical protein HAX54_039404, partial [Datura stramonium]|nr:hypothetical protein [Datura stramonium]
KMVCQLKDGLRMRKKAILNDEAKNGQSFQKMQAYKGVIMASWNENGFGGLITHIHIVEDSIFELSTPQEVVVEEEIFISMDEAQNLYDHNDY